MFIWILLAIIFVLALGGGGWGYSRYGRWSLSPAIAILLVVLVLFYTGNLSWN